MVKTIEALFDGTVIRPDEPLALEPNTRLKITIEAIKPVKKTRKKKTASFLDTALSMKIEGPSDWSENIDKYLYGDLVPDEK